VGPSQPPVQKVAGLYPGSKATRACVDHPHPCLEPKFKKG